MRLATLVIDGISASSMAYALALGVQKMTETESDDPDIMRVAAICMRIQELLMDYCRLVKDDDATETKPEVRYDA